MKRLFRNKAQSTGRLTLSMIALQAFKAIASIILVIVAASYFGADIRRDAWVVSWGFQLLLFKLFFAAFHDIFRAKFIQIREDEGLGAAVNSAYSLLLFLLLMSALIVCGVLIFNQQIIDLYTPGYKQLPEYGIIQSLFCWMIPALLLGQINGIFSSILNVSGEYFTPELLSTLAVLINIVAILLGADYFGIYILVLAYYTGTILSAISLGYQLRKKRLLPEAYRLHWPVVKPYVQMAMPLFVGYFIAQIVAFTEKVLISYLPPGSNASLDYARKFIDSPNILIAVFAGSVVVPIVGKHMKQGKPTIISDQHFYQFCRMLLLVLSPLLVIFCICSEELITLLLYRGDFEASWIAPTAKALRFFGLGLPGLILFLLAGQYLLLEHKAKLYARFFILMYIAQLLLNVLLIDKWGISIFAFSWSITNSACALTMLFLLKPQSGSALKMLGPVLGVIIVGLLISYLVHLSIKDWPVWLILVSLTVIYSISLVLMAFIFRLKEAGQIPVLGRLIRKE